MSIYNRGNLETPEGNKNYDEWRKELDESGFKLIRQRSMGTKERVGFIGIFTTQEWDDLLKKKPTAKHMTKYETPVKTGFMCNCGCLTFQQQMLKSTCCGARYVDDEHIKKHWKEHKKVCKEYKKKKAEQKKADEKKIEDMIEEGYESILEEIKEKPLLEQQEILDMMSGKMFKMPTNREEELAMFVCPMSCDGCDFCEYVPKFAFKE